MKHKKLAAASITAALVTGGGTAAVLGGLPAALAQTDGSTEEASPGGWVAEALAQLVDDGTLTPAQLEAVQEALAEARPHRGGHARVPLDVVAEAIGIEVDALRDALRDGQTIAEVAEGHGVPVDGVIDAILVDLEQHLAERVANGDKTQEEADAILEGAPERIAAIVNGEAPLGGHPRGPHGAGPRGPRG